MNHTYRFIFAALLCSFCVFWYLRRSRQTPDGPDDPAAFARGGLPDAGVTPDAGPDAPTAP